MAMGKKDFIALADAIRLHNSERHEGEGQFTISQINVLARFCQSQNPNFNRERWFGYIAGTNGPSGGSVK
jgi:hypothetical protein